MKRSSPRRRRRAPVHGMLGWSNIIRGCTTVNAFLRAALVAEVEVRLLFIVCEANVEERVLNELVDVGCPGYTRFSGAIGYGSRGRREGSPVWPGLNSLVISAVPDELEQDVVSRLRALEAERGSGLALKVFASECRELL